MRLCRAVAAVGEPRAATLDDENGLSSGPILNATSGHIASTGRPLICSLRRACEHRNLLDRGSWAAIKWHLDGKAVSGGAQLNELHDTATMTDELIERGLYAAIT